MKATHYKLLGRNITLCGTINPSYFTRDLGGVDCLKCRRTQAFKRIWEQQGDGKTLRAAPGWLINKLTVGALLSIQDCLQKDTSPIVEEAILEALISLAVETGVGVKGEVVWPDVNTEQINQG